MLELANVDKTAVGGVISDRPNSPVYNLVNANMSPTLGWILLVVVVARLCRADARRRGAAPARRG